MATKQRSGKGRAEHKRTAQGRTHQPNLTRFYAHALSDWRPLKYEFRLTLLRGKGIASLPITPATESFEWTDDQAVLRGTITFRRPESTKGSLPIGRGHQVRCQVKSGSNWRELWRMRLKSPDTDVGAATVTCEMADDLELLAASKDDFHFGKSKKNKPKGWLPHQIAVHICRLYGVRPGKIVRGKHRITKLTLKNKSPLDVIRAAYAHERKKTGRRYIINMEGGKLNVRPFKRNPVLYTMAELIESALLSQQTNEDKFATVLEAKGHIGKGKQAKKVRLTEFRRNVVRRYGYIKQQFNAGKVDSRADLRRQARRELAKRIRFKKTASLDHTCIPYIRRGDGVKMLLPAEGYKGKAAFVFCSSVTHTVSGSTRTMSLELKSNDPFQADKERREKELRAIKRAARKKRKNK